MTGPLWTSLPAGWRTGQMKNAATVTLGKMLQSAASGNDVSAPYMRAANVQPDGVLALDDVKRMWFDSAELERLSIRGGDVVVVEGGQGGFGRAAYVRKDLSGWGFQNSINRLRPKRDVDGRFLGYYLIALRASGFIHAYANVVSMPHLTADKLERVPVPLPPAEMQRAIADYLDRETDRIDTLIEEQQRLIGMLRERRRAVIEWGVADIVADQAALRYVARLVSGSGFPVDAQGSADEELPFFKVKDLQSANLSGILVAAADTVSRETATTLRAAVIPGGSLVFAKVGAALMLGRVGALPVDGCIDNNMSALIFDPAVDPHFARYLMLTFGFARFVQPGAVPSLNMEAVREFKIPLISRDHQRSIVEHLDGQTAKIDGLIVETERFIELSRERRSALITAAVTGQIDVREVA